MSVTSFRFSFLLIGCRRRDVIRIFMCETLSRTRVFKVFELNFLVCYIDTTVLFTPYNVWEAYFIVYIIIHGRFQTPSIIGGFLVFVGRNITPANRRGILYIWHVRWDTEGHVEHENPLITLQSSQLEGLWIQWRLKTWTSHCFFYVRRI